MNDRIELEKEQARQGETSGRMRKVLMISTALAIGLGAVVLISAQ